jgi:MoaA/NifB/PqqE/SkfB family radical SAM enzyme
MALNSQGSRSIDEIGFYTLSEKRAERVAALYRQGDPFVFKTARTEVVVGNRCNFACRFCKGVPTDGTFELTSAYLSRLFEEWTPRGTDYLHITGGEPTLWTDLRELVAAVAARGTVPCMTSNGSAPFSLYRHLVETGLRDIRISLHAHDPGLYGWISGTSSAFHYVVENIRRLVDLRDRAFPDLYIMINTCVLEETLDELPALLRFLLAFNPNDIKPVAIVQWAGRRLAEAREHYRNDLLPALLDATPDSAFPILRYRLPSLLTKRLRGFRGRPVNGGQAAVQSCYLMLDDRCIDARWYYPCNIYLRERGTPIGSHHEDSYEEAARKIWDFVHHHDVREDPICRACCPDIAREYNAYVASLLEEKKAVQERRIIC